jgi:PKD repeat protein
MALEKIYTNYPGYVVGDLSLYPSAVDSFNNLYEAKNNSTTIMTSSLSVTGTNIAVQDTSSFPDQGILRLSLPNQKGTAVEFVYYNNKTDKLFYNLIRGFMETRINPWPLNSVVESGVFAEHHNALKDATINVENFIGTTVASGTATVTGLLQDLEYKYLNPNPVFRAFPLQGIPPLTVNFHCLTNRLVGRFFWDFGDGGSSYEKNPIHTYAVAGSYTVQLRTISTIGGQGIATKFSYINVGNQYSVPYGYVTPHVGTSRQTAGNSATTFTFVDQTQGPILNRLWQFGGTGANNSIFVENPNVHVVTHVYDEPGIYKPTVLVTIEDNLTTRAIFADSITVT